MNVKSLSRQVNELREEVSSLGAKLADERVVNIDLDITNQEQNTQINELTKYKALFDEERSKNQELQEIIKESQKQSNATKSKMTQNKTDDDEFGKFDTLNLGENENDEDSSEASNEDKELRHRLLEEQMKHETLKHIHRKSMAKIEDFELQYATGDTDETPSAFLKSKINELQNRLEDERKKTENLDKQRRNSLAQLSQNMFKKLLDAEHQHLDAASSWEEKCRTLYDSLKQLEESKKNLLLESNKTIDELRGHIKVLSTRLQKYE